MRTSVRESLRGCPGRARSHPPQAMGGPIKHSSQLRQKKRCWRAGGGRWGIKNTTGRRRRSSLEAPRNVCPSALLWIGTDLWRISAQDPVRTDQKEHKERFAFNNSVTIKSSGYGFFSPSPAHKQNIKFLRRSGSGHRRQQSREVLASDDLRGPDQVEH